MGFEPTRAEHIGLAGRRLNLSATLSMLLLEDFFISGVVIYSNESSDRIQKYFMKVYVSVGE